MTVGGAAFHNERCKNSLFSKRVFWNGGEGKRRQKLDKWPGKRIERDGESRLKSVKLPDVVKRAGGRSAKGALKSVMENKKRKEALGKLGRPNP